MKGWLQWVPSFSPCFVMLVLFPSLTIHLCYFFFDKLNAVLLSTSRFHCWSFSPAHTIIGRIFSTITSSLRHYIAWTKIFGTIINYDAIVELERSNELMTPLSVPVFFTETNSRASSFAELSNMVFDHIFAQPWKWILIFTNILANAPWWGLSFIVGFLKLQLCGYSCQILQP